MTKEIEQQLEDLGKRVEKVRRFLKYAPRPFVIEFAGTPKSGKSTSLEAIRHLLGRHGFRVHVLAERAAVCPIPMKGHLFFNMWCAGSMLAELLATVETESEVILVDRGLFDALAWVTLQQQRGELSGHEARTIESFLLLDRWSSLIDLVVVMNVSADEALARENAVRITRRGGSIMSQEVLAAVSESVEKAVDRYQQHFRLIVKHDTANEDVQTSTIRLANKILEVLEQFLNPKVLVVSRKEIERLVAGNKGTFGAESFQQAMNCIGKFGNFLERDEAENRDDLVQIVTTGVLVRDDRVFLFQRKEADPKYLLYGKTTIWQGSHVQDEPNTTIPDLLRVTLQGRLSRSLFLSRAFQTEELGFTWDAEDKKSSHHLGMMYSMTIDNPHTAADLRKKEFKRKRGHGLVGEFVSWDQLIERSDELNLESWSRGLLKYKLGQSNG
jgi:predicted NUDIX family phosphoesterase/thymidylate kinase